MNGVGKMGRIIIQVGCTIVCTAVILWKLHKISEHDRAMAAGRQAVADAERRHLSIV